MAIQLPFVVLPRPIPAITTGNQQPNRPAIHLTIPKSVGLVWRTNGAGNAWIVANLGGTSAFDFVALLNTNAQPGTVQRVRTGASEAGCVTAPQFDSSNLLISPPTTTNTGLYHSHVELPPQSAQSAQFVRIDITAHVGDFEAATLIVGTRMTPSRFYDADYERGTKDMGEVTLNRWGVAAEEPGVVLRTLAFRLGWLNRAEYENGFRPLIEAIGTRGLSYWCFDPEPTPDRQRKTYFGRCEQSPVASTGKAPGRMAIPFQILSII